jgi:hypothetical protein
MLLTEEYMEAEEGGRRDSISAAGGADGSETRLATMGTA